MSRNLVRPVLLGIPWVWLWLLLWSGGGVAASLRHSIWLSHTGLGFQSQMTCPTLAKAGGRLYCDGGLGSSSEGKAIELRSLIKANEDGFDIFQRLIAEDVDEPFLEKLFRDQNFQDASLVLKVGASYRGYSIAYVPYHFIGAFKMSNPSFPHLYASLGEQSVFEVGKHSIFGSESSYWGMLVLDTKASSYERRETYADFDLIQLAVARFEDLTEKKTWRGYGLSLGLRYLPRWRYLPSVGLELEDLFSKKVGSNDRVIDLGFLYNPKAAVVFSYGLEHGFGESYIGIRLPFDVESGAYNALDTAVSYIFSLSELKAVLSFSSRMKSFGFVLDGSVYSVGIQYSYEKQDNTLRIGRSKQTYVYAKLHL